MENKCSQCGVCCRLFLINLTKEEYNSGKYKTQFEELVFFKDFKEAVSCGANILKQKEDGSCIYLKNDRCSIHQDRPKACRSFFCSSKLKKYQAMISQIKAYKNQTSSKL